MTAQEFVNHFNAQKRRVGTYTGDFFVYSQFFEEGFHDHHWGGYFSSRPLIKNLIRKTFDRLHAVNLFAKVAVASSPRFGQAAAE